MTINIQIDRSGYPVYRMGVDRVLDIFIQDLDAFADREVDIDYTGIEIYGIENSTAIEISVECSNYNGNIVEVLTLIVSEDDEVIGGVGQYLYAPKMNINKKAVWDWVTSELSRLE